MKRWIKKCIQEAKKTEEFKFRVGAVVFNKGEFISSGHNYPNKSIKKHHPKFRKMPDSIHAEVDAIIRAKKDLKGSSILVIRINSNDEYRMSRPCKYCQMYLRHVGIKYFYYSISKFPYIVREKIS
jgi:deoxycytidylate deaminase